MASDLSMNCERISWNWATPQLLRSESCGKIEGWTSCIPQDSMRDMEKLSQVDFPRGTPGGVERQGVPLVPGSEFCWKIHDWPERQAWSRPKRPISTCDLAHGLIVIGPIIPGGKPLYAHWSWLLRPSHANRQTHKHRVIHVFMWAVFKARVVWWLVGDYPTQYIGDYSNPIEESRTKPTSTRMMEWEKDFEHCAHLFMSLLISYISYLPFS